MAVMLYIRFALSLRKRLAGLRNPDQGHPVGNIPTLGNVARLTGVAVIAPGDAWAVGDGIPSGRHSTNNGRG